MKQVDLSELASLTGMRRQSIQAALDKAEVKPVDALKKGTKRTTNVFNSTEALRAIYQGNDATKALREREAKARTEKIEIEVAQMKGELVEINLVAKAVENEYTIVRQRLLSVPNKLAKPLSHVESPTEIQNILTDSICECLEELRHDQKAKRQASGSSKENSKATTTKKPGSVVRSRKTPVARK